MHPEILSKEQKELLPLVRTFSGDFYLVGGSAIALQIGHRMSVDYDLFTSDKIKRKKIKSIIDKSNFSTEKVIYEAQEQFHIPVNSVKMTFYNYPFNIKHPLWFENIITMPQLLDLAAMKAFALGGRAKWRDYIDLYFIFKHHHTFKEVAEKSNELFGNFFNVKLFREQLTFFKDIDNDQQIQFITAPVSDEEIKNYLIDAATQPF